jgi:hypothetical protein
MHHILYIRWGGDSSVLLDMLLSPDNHALRYLVTALAALDRASPHSVTPPLPPPPTCTSSCRRPASEAAADIFTEQPQLQAAASSSIRIDKDSQQPEAAAAAANTSMRKDQGGRGGSRCGGGREVLLAAETRLWLKSLLGKLTTLVSLVYLLYWYKSTNTDAIYLVHCYKSANTDAEGAAGEEGADAFQCRAPRAAACARARALVKPQAAEA